jgi:hypothetical protein
VRALADGSDLEAAALYRMTGGNPFYVTEVLQAGMAKVPASAKTVDHHISAVLAKLGAPSRNAAAAQAAKLGLIS